VKDFAEGTIMRAIRDKLLEYVEAEKVLRDNSSSRDARNYRDGIIKGLHYAVGVMYTETEKAERGW